MPRELQLIVIRHSQAGWWDTTKGPLGSATGVGTYGDAFFARRPWRETEPSRAGGTKRL